MPFPDSTKKAPNIFLSVDDQSIISNKSVFSNKLDCCCASPPQQVDVSNIPPTHRLVADFVGEPLIGYAPLTVDFYDLSTGNPTSWGYDFTNNGSTDSILQSPPNIVFSNPGVYSVSQTIANKYMTDSQVKIDYITVLSIPYNARWIDPATDSNGTLSMDNPTHITVTF